MGLVTEVLCPVGLMSGGLMLQHHFFHLLNLLDMCTILVGVFVVSILSNMTVTPIITMTGPEHFTHNTVLPSS